MVFLLNAASYVFEVAFMACIHYSAKVACDAKSSVAMILDADSGNC